MISFERIAYIVTRGWNGRTIKQAFAYYGLRCPENITEMRLYWEPVEYIVAAVLAVNQVGE